MNSLRHGMALVLALAGAAACGLGDAGEPSLPQATPPGPVQITTEIHAPEDCIKPACQDVALQASPHVLRLSNLEWERTVQDLLKLDTAPGSSSTFPKDPVPKEFAADAAALKVNAAGWRQYRAAAEAVSALITSAPDSIAKILPAAAKPGAGDTTARVAAFVTDFLPRAYRRPVAAAEIAAVIAEGEKAVQSDVTSDPFLLRVKWILTGILQSPHFLYRTALGDGPVVNGRARLGPHEIAAKLSYAIWGTMPDDTLTEAAKSGQLGTNAGIAAVAKAMLQDVRAESSLIDFHDKLYLANQYTDLTTKDDRTVDVFPDVYDGFFADAQADVRQTVKDLVITHQGGVKELNTSTVAYVNAALAPIYGINPATLPNSGFNRIEMNPAERAGVLMHPGWLTFKGTPKDPSTILRGVFMVRHALCLPMGGPPKAAAGANVGKSPLPTNRERVAATTKGCGDLCHGGAAGVINPLGFLFEDFDSIGKHRTSELTPDGTRAPIDTKAQVPEVGSFPSAVPLFQSLATNPRVHACYAAHWFAYLNGSTQLDVTPRYLSPALAVSLKGGSVRDIITELVQTDAFLTVSR